MPRQNRGLAEEMRQEAEARCRAGESPTAIAKALSVPTHHVFSYLQRRGLWVPTPRPKRQKKVPWVWTDNDVAALRNWLAIGGLELAAERMTIPWAALEAKAFDLGLLTCRRAGVPIDDEKRRQLVQALESGIGAATISRNLGIDRMTVLKYRRMVRACGGERTDS